ncbi:unnamed protein product [Merluccius merluccius]
MKQQDSSVWCRVVMAVFYGAILLGLLVVTSAAPAPSSNCTDVVTPLPSSQLDKIFGSWVLVGGMSNEGLLPMLNNSHMEMSLSEDNSSVIYIEENMFNNGSCVWFSIVGKPMESSNLTMELSSVLREADGVVVSPKTGGKLSYYQNCPACEDFQLTVLYTDDTKQTNNTSAEWFVLNYRREGKHLEGLIDVPQNTMDQAECLQMTDNTGLFTYDGVSG